MKSGYLQILIIFAIFIIPEILKLMRSKKKKYEYPDEQQRYEYEQEREDTSTKTKSQQELPTDFWDILTGRNHYDTAVQSNTDMLETETAKQTKPDAAQPVADSLQIATKRSSKLSAKSAAKGLIWAEVLGKPRALRPIERELPYKRGYH